MRLPNLGYATAPSLPACCTPRLPTSRAANAVAPRIELRGDTAERLRHPVIKVTLPNLGEMVRPVRVVIVPDDLSDSQINAQAPHTYRANPDGGIRHSAFPPLRRCRADQDHDRRASGARVRAADDRGREGLFQRPRH